MSTTKTFHKEFQSQETDEKAGEHVENNLLGVATELHVFYIPIPLTNSHLSTEFPDGAQETMNNTAKPNQVRYDSRQKKPSGISI